MTHGSLFSGIGGFDLAAEWMGWENIFHCEWMPFPRQILNYYWPKAKSYEDITKTDFTIHRGQIDVLTGGFPCQPYSSAGARLGKDDERHLWPEMLRAIQEIEPTWVVGENVRGLTNWNGGVVFEEVCADLENCGYEVQPLLLGAAGVGAPHQRYRVWFVAYNKSKRTWKFPSENVGGQDRRFDNNGENGDVADAMSIRLQQREDKGEVGRTQKEIRREGGGFTNAAEADGQVSNASNTNSDGLEGGVPSDINRQVSSEKEYDEKRLSIREQRIRFESFPTESPVCGGNDGVSYGLDGITFSKWRQESIKGYGNAIVPQVCLQLFRVIEKMDNDAV